MHALLPKVSGAFKVPSGGIMNALKANTPTGMVIVGCIGIIGGVVLACNATLKADAILDEIEQDVEKVNHVKDIAPEEKYSQNDYQHDLTIAYAKGGAKLAKLYAPAALVIAASIAMILGGHKILMNRYVAAGAACELLQTGYDNYRKRVREDLGKDADLKYAYGLEEETVSVTEVDEEGKSHKKKVKAQKVNRDNALTSIDAFYWDNTCRGWEDNVYYNETFLINKQAYWNRELSKCWPIDGVVTLAEIKRDLGAIVKPSDIRRGWRYDPDYKPEEHDGKPQIDFGIFHPRNANVVNGSESVYILEPNVQGDLYYSTPY